MISFVNEPFETKIKSFHKTQKGVEYRLETQYRNSTKPNVGSLKKINKSE